MNQSPLLHAIFVGQPKTLTDERGTWTSSICRDRVNEAVHLAKEGLVGDKVAQPYHGGPESAVCVHLLDHYRFWEQEYDLCMPPGYLGENFAVDNLTEDQVCAGDIVRLGSAWLQVSGPRVPCANQARRVGGSDWVKLTIRENRTGFYMRVLEPGIVQAGDAWELKERPNPDGSIPAINRCMYLSFDPAYARRAIEIPGLADWWKEQMAERLEKQDAHWTASMKE